MKRLLGCLYIVVVAVMAAATILEKYQGTEHVADHVYGAWWFSLLWGMLAASATLYFLQRRVRRPATVALHLSFAIILLGALTTHVFARRGVIHLRVGQQTGAYLTRDMQEHPLPFLVRLDRFGIRYHEGTRAPADYISRLTLIDGQERTAVTVSMNNIASHRGIRLYQSSYDDDEKGSVLALNSDPWGIPITYTGYALLFLSLVWMLLDPKGAYRQLLRSPLLRRGALTLVCLLALQGTALAAPVLPRETADRFGRLNILYNDRICPMQTYAIDFTRKLCGRARYGDYTAEQVLTGFIFWGDEWSNEPIIEVKGSELRQASRLPRLASVNAFFNPTTGYILGTYVQEHYQGRQDALHRQAAQVDDKLMLVMELRRGTPLRVFPYTDRGATTWYSPTQVDSTVEAEHRRYMQEVFSLMNEDARAGRFDRVDVFLDKMLKYQRLNGGRSIPSPTRLEAERIHNRIPFATILFMLNLTMGFLTLGLFIYRLTRRKRHGQLSDRLARSLLVLSLMALTGGLALRWTATGHVPMSNGYETMLLMSWLVMVLALVAYLRFRIAITFGFLLSGFFLLVSHINQMDPQIGHLMPVLDSPLLSIHVSIIMMAFALLSMTFICSVTALLIRNVSHHCQEQLESLALLSRLFLYPALTMLGMGIFIGAIWANVSWGTYWSWDPKEVWALITFMVYAAAVHTRSLPLLGRPYAYHVFMALAFLTILMTYFGVNFFLGGMHAYA